MPGAVRTAVEFLLAYPDIAMVYGDCNLIDEDSRVIGSYPTEDFDLRRLIAF
jgi:hypothetical protein